MERYYKIANTVHRELSVIPAPSHHEDLRAVYCLKKLQEFGINDAYIDTTKNVICEVKSNCSNKTVIFAAHTDVVFPDTEPFALREDENNIYCPGCGDDTICVAQLLSVIKKLKDENKNPKINVVFAFDSCEEGLGNLKGIRAVMDRYGKNAVGFFSFDGQYNEVIDTSVGSHRYKVTVKTKGGHSFNDFGNISAARVLAKGIGMIYEINVPEGGKTTYNVGVFSGGTSVNTIAQKASMLCEYRSDTFAHLNYMRDEFYRVFSIMSTEATVDIELVGDRPGMSGVDPVAQAALTDLCMKIQEKHTGIKPERTSGSTDCNIAHSLGIPAVCVGTYKGGGVHTYEEWVEKDSLALGVDIIADIVGTYFQ